MKALLVGLTLATFSAPALADKLILPVAQLRSGTATAVYHIDSPTNGTLEWDWTDVFGRLIDHGRISVGPSQRDIPIALDLSRAVTMRNDLRAEFGPSGKIGPIVKASFISRPPSGHGRTTRSWSGRTTRRRVIRIWGASASAAPWSTPKAAISRKRRWPRG